MVPIGHLYIKPATFKQVCRSSTIGTLFYDYVVNIVIDLNLSAFEGDVLTF